MATKEAAKKAAKSIAGKARKRDESDCTPVVTGLPTLQLRNMIYLWLFTTVTYLPCLNDQTTPNDIYNALSATGGKFKKDDGFVTSILEAMPNLHRCFGRIREILLNANTSATRGGWGGHEGHPSTDELNAIFISPDLKKSKTRHKK